MDESRFVILGGGMVGGYAAKQLAELGLKPGELAILSADTSIPYERPPLSKGFLAGKDTEDTIRINPAAFYREHGIEVRLGCEISAVDPKRKRLTLKSGGEFGFSKLIVATGARPRTLDIPGASLRHIHYLRAMGDSKAIRRSAGKSEKGGRDRWRLHWDGSGGGVGAEGNRSHDGFERATASGSGSSRHRCPVSLRPTMRCAAYGSSRKRRLPSSGATERFVRLSSVTAGRSHARWWSRASEHYR